MFAVDYVNYLLYKRLTVLICAFKFVAHISDISLKEEDYELKSANKNYV